MSVLSYRCAGKRVLDVVGAGLGVLMFLPILIAAAIAVWLFLGRPVFFSQMRPGLNGIPFRLRKLRTMRQSTMDASHDHERLTRLGRVLRASSIDELPELWCVLSGDMSLVGPRPLLTQYLDRYSPEQARRHEVKPGITGWAQVSGRNMLPWERKFELDVWYVDNVSFWLDIKILMLTAWKVILRRGINAPGEATAPEFMGSGPCA